MIAKRKGAVVRRDLKEEQSKAELQKLKDEFERRNGESASARHERIEKYEKQRDENGALLLEFPKAFISDLGGEEMNGHPAYILSATPGKRSGSGLAVR